MRYFTAFRTIVLIYVIALLVWTLPLVWDKLRLSLFQAL